MRESPEGDHAEGGHSGRMMDEPHGHTRGDNTRVDECGAWKKMTSGERVWQAQSEIGCLG